MDLRERNSWRLLMHEVPDGGTARSAARQRHRAVHPQRAAQAAHAAHAGARQAHRQRLRGGGAVLPQVQDHAASAHEHGQGRAQHDDAHRRRRLSRRRHPHERRGHRLGDGRRPGAHRRAQGGGASLPSAAGHRGRRGAHRGPDHRRLQHRRARLGKIPEGLPRDGLVKNQQSEFNKDRLL